MYVPKDYPALFFIENGVLPLIIQKELLAALKNQTLEPFQTGALYNNLFLDPVIAEELLFLSTQYAYKLLENYTFSTSTAAKFAQLIVDRHPTNSFVDDIFPKLLLSLAKTQYLSLDQLESQAHLNSSILSYALDAQARHNLNPSSTTTPNSSLDRIREFSPDPSLLPATELPKLLKVENFAYMRIPAIWITWVTLYLPKNIQSWEATMQLAENFHGSFVDFVKLLTLTK